MNHTSYLLLATFCKNAIAFRMIKRTIALLLASASLSVASTKSVFKIWQPLSLHGTDVASVLGAESGVDYAVLMSRPVVLSGALPEALVYAVALKHQMSSNTTYSEPDANLLSLYGIKLDAVLSEEGECKVTVDVSKTELLPDVDISLDDAVRLTVTAIKRTLEEYGAAYLESDMACSISVIGDAESPHLAEQQKFNTKFTVKATAETDAE